MEMTQTEEAIAKAIAGFISAHVSKHGANGTRLELYPDRFVHVRADDNGVQLSFSEETSKDYYDDIISAREWLFAELLIDGIRFEFQHPLPLTERGKCDYAYAHTAGTPEGFLEWLRFARPNKRHALLESAKSLRVLRSYTTSVGSTDRRASWSTHGRPVAALNKWLKRFAVPTLDTTQGNALLALIDECLLQHRASCRWIEGRIGRFYNEHANPPYTSCMAGDPEEWFELYDYMQRRDQLQLMEIVRAEEHIGRALVWFGSNPDDKYLDRIYAPPYRDSFEPDVVQAIKDFCAAEGIMKTVYPQTAERIGLCHVSGFSIDTGAGPEDFSYYPYVDSMRYFGHDGRLRNYSGREAIVLDQTDGGPHVEDYVTLENGDRVPKDDARYCQRFDEWHHMNDVTWSSLHHDWIPDDRLLELHDGTYTFDDNDEVVQLHNGEHALIDDTIELHDGEHALACEATELHDGSYALADDCVQLYNGEYALSDDTLTLPDGRVVLRSDCEELEDGTFVLTCEQSN